MIRYEFSFNCARQTSLLRRAGMQDLVMCMPCAWFVAADDGWEAFYSRVPPHRRTDARGRRDGVYAQAMVI